MGKQQLLKAHNRVTLLNVIRKRGAISRAELARQTGLIYEKQEGDSRGGRPPILLALQPKGAYVVGLKLTEDHITFALTNLDADVVDRLTVTSERTDPEWMAQRVGDGLARLLERSE